MGQVKAPQVTSFVFHPQMLTTLAAVGWLVYSTYAPSMKHTEYAHLFAPGNFVLSFFPPWMLRFAWGLLIFFHGLESLYVANLCRKHQTGLFVGVRYMLHAICSACRSHADVHVPFPRWKLQYWLSAMLIGFPTIISLRKQIQEARIASILKGQ